MTNRSRLPLWLPLLAVACLAVPASAQTPVLKLAWDYDVAALSAVSTYQHTVLIDGAPVTGTVTCVAGRPPAAVTCTLPAPPLSAGTHTMVVIAKVGANERSTSQTVDPAQMPGSPGRFRILLEGTITITPVP
jgi:hypothetical protein